MKNNQKPSEISPVDTLETSLNINDAVAELKNCLGAVRTYWDGVQKKKVQEPDYRTRLQAIELILNYKIGRPVERKEILVHTTKTLAELRAMAAASPELQASLKALMGGEK